MSGNCLTFAADFKTKVLTIKVVRMMDSLYVHYVGNIELSMTLEDAKKCSHQGYCDYDVHEVTQKQYIQEQLKDYSDEDIKEALEEYTIECDNLDRTDMQEYVTWLVAGNIVEEQRIK